MAIIDSQVHTYERNHPGRPWVGVLHGPPEVTGADMVAAMDAVGVDGALLVSPFAMYRFDASYAVEVDKQHPGRFGLIKPVDTADPAVAEVVADWAAIDGTVGIRIIDAFDVDRCLWGTDWTRAVGLLTYKQGVDAFRLTERLSVSDREALMGGTLQRIYDWAPSKA